MTHADHVGSGRGEVRILAQRTFESVQIDVVERIDEASEWIRAAHVQGKYLAAVGDGLGILRDRERVPVFQIGGRERVAARLTEREHERLRKAVSSKRVHRCAECGWRGWLFVLIPLEEEDPGVQQEVPDLASLDHGIGQSPMRVAL